MGLLFSGEAFHIYKINKDIYHYRTKPNHNFNNLALKVLYEIKQIL